MGLKTVKAGRRWLRDTEQEAAHPEHLLAVTVTEAARLIGISRQSAYNAASKKELPVIRIGRRVLVARSALEAMFKGAGQ